ncbi:MAG: PD-(D/E)XK motif protein [Caldilineaceae bacterium]|nr:PD-(D/E)XK motif protein [Caldilineaceae bacterium]
MISEQFWRELEAQTPPGAGIVRRRVREGSTCNLFIGVAHPRRERVLILVVSANAASNINLPTTRGLKTIQTDGGTGEIELRITLIAPEMKNVFTPFCSDVIDAVAPADNDRVAVSILLKRFANWQRFFATAGVGLSSLEAQALFGELWVLEHLFLPLSGVQSVESWRGPDREDRDFLIRGLAIEVKTTSGDEPFTVIIANEGQLNVGGLDVLYLVAFKLEVLKGRRGTTLNDAVASIRSTLAPEAALLFRDKLLRYGYLDQHSDRYSDVAYVIREIMTFRVEEGFPRIIENDLVPGVGSVRYRLALSACEPWRRTLQELHKAVTDTASGTRG